MVGAQGAERGAVLHHGLEVVGLGGLTLGVLQHQPQVMSTSRRSWIRLRVNAGSANGAVKPRLSSRSIVASPAPMVWRLSTPNHSTV
jgi:hypothetical protein